MACIQFADPFKKVMVVRVNCLVNEAAQKYELLMCVGLIKSSTRLNFSFPPHQPRTTTTKMEQFGVRREDFGFPTNHRLHQPTPSRVTPGPSAMEQAIKQAPTLQDLYDCLRDSPEYKVVQLFIERLQIEENPNMEEIYQMYLDKGNKPMKKLVFKAKGGYPKDVEIDPAANWGIWQRMHGNPEMHRRYPLDHVPYPPQNMEIKWVSPDDPDYPPDDVDSTMLSHQDNDCPTPTLSPRIPPESMEQLAQAHHAAATFHDADDAIFFPAAGQQMTTDRLPHEAEIKVHPSIHHHKSRKTRQQEAYEQLIAIRDAGSSYNSYATPAGSSSGHQYAENASGLPAMHQFSASNTPTVSRSMQKSASQIARGIGAKLTANAKEGNRLQTQRASLTSQLRPESPAFNFQSSSRKTSNESQGSATASNLGTSHLATSNIGKGNHTNELLEILRQTGSASATPQAKVHHALHPSTQPDLMETIGKSAGPPHNEFAPWKQQQGQEHTGLFSSSGIGSLAGYPPGYHPATSLKHSQPHLRKYIQEQSGSLGSSSMGSSSGYLQSFQQGGNFYRPDARTSQLQPAPRGPSGHSGRANQIPSEAKQVPLTQGEMNFGSGQAKPFNFTAPSTDLNFKPQF